MSTPLFSDNEMNDFRQVALQGMQDDITIYRRTTVSTVDGMSSVWALLTTVKGWIYGTPTQHQELVSGVIATVNTYRLFVPVGTDIQQSDKVMISGHTEEYMVADTVSENTWNAMLRVSLRFAE